MTLGTLERRLLFKPRPPGDALPSDLGLDFEESWCKSEGNQLHCWFILGDRRPDLTWVYFGGISGNMGMRVGEFAALHTRTGMNVFAFDYSGFGHSDGKASVAQTARDARAALFHLRYKYCWDVAFLGVSMGAAVAVRLATEVTPTGMVLVSPFASLRDMGRLHHPWLTLGGRLVGNRYDSISLISRINCPLLIIHGIKDDVIPMSQGHQLWEAARNPRQGIAIPGAGHEDVGDHPKFWSTLCNWLNYLEAPRSTPIGGLIWEGISPLP